MLKGEKRISEVLKGKNLILILVAGILFTSLSSMPLANAQPYYDAYFTSIKVTHGTGDIALISGGTAKVYDGQLTYIPAVKSYTANTSLTIAVPSAPQGKECTIEATLKDENDNPLQNTDIDFYVCGTSKIGTAKTDSNGVASLKFTPPTTGTYKVNAMFSGTTNYAQSSSEDVYIILIDIDYTPYIVGGGIIALAIIGVAGYIVFRRRKKAMPTPKTVKEA